MSTRFYYGQQDYIVQLNLMDDIATSSATSAAGYAAAAQQSAIDAANAAASAGQADWNATSGPSKILNKPTLAAVATSGNKADVGLGNVDNTSDANKPVSTATQTALNGKEPTVAAGTVSQFYKGNKTWAALASADVTGALGFTPYNASNPNGYITASGNAATATNIAWTGVTGKPTTIAGYGITDALSVTGTAAAATKLATARTINGVSFDGTANISLPVNNGTSADVIAALGYTPYNATNPNGYITGSGNAATATNVAWTGITGKPTTLVGYGINGDIANYAPSLTGSGASGTWGINVTGNAATATNVAWGGITGKPTTLGGYGITDAYTYAGTYAAANVDTIAGTGYYLQTDPGASSTVSVINVGGSTGPLQQRWTYAGDFLFRNKTDSATWTGWKTVVTSSNVGSYAPSLTGIGASGTWNISVNGYANALNVQVSNEMILANGFGGGTLWMNYRGASSAITQVNVASGRMDGALAAINASNIDASGNITGSAMKIKASGNPHQFNWSGQSGQPTWLWGSPSDANNSYLYNPSNFSVNYANGAGATARLDTAGMYIWSASTTPSGYNMGTQVSFVQAANGFQSYGTVITTKGYSGGGGSLQMYVPYSPGNGGNMLQVRFGNYEVNGGDSWTSWRQLWDTYSLANPLYEGGSFGTVVMSNWFRSTGDTGWFNGTYGGGIHMTDTTWVRVYNGKALYVSNDIYSTGNITAYSDERVKTNWRDTGSDFIERWAKMKKGTYDRTDVAKTQVGTSAQDVQAILPHAVTEVDGQLSLNYGGAAIVATVKLAERLVEMTELVAKLQTRIEELEKK